MSDNVKKLNVLLARVLNVDENLVTDTSSPDTVESWDSYNGLMLVSELEKDFNVHFTMDEVVAVKNVGDIKMALIKHGVVL